MFLLKNYTTALVIWLMMTLGFDCTPTAGGWGSGNGNGLGIGVGFGLEMYGY